MGGCPPSAGPTGSPRPGPMAAVQSVPNLRVQNFPIRLQDPRLNWVPGASPDGHPSVTYIQQLRLAFFNQFGGCMVASPNRLAYHGCIQKKYYAQYNR